MTVVGHRTGAAGGRPLQALEPDAGEGRWWTASIWQPARLPGDEPRALRLSPRRRPVAGRADAPGRRGHRSRGEGSAAMSSPTARWTSRCEGTADLALVSCSPTTCGGQGAARVSGGGGGTRPRRGWTGRWRCRGGAGAPAARLPARRRLTCRDRALTRREAPTLRPHRHHRRRAGGAGGRGRATRRRASPPSSVHRHRPLSPRLPRGAAQRVVGRRPAPVRRRQPAVAHRHRGRAPGHVDPALRPRHRAAGRRGADRAARAGRSAAACATTSKVSAPGTLPHRQQPGHPCRPGRT